MESTIIIPKSTHVEFDIPEEYIGKEVEFTFQPVKESKKEVTMADFWGFMSDETANDLRKNIEEGRLEWERDI